MKNLIVVFERAWRKWFVYPVFRLVLRNKRVALPLDLSSVNSVLILRYDKIGDMIVTLPIFRILKSRNPQLHIGVLASETNVEIVRNEKSVDRIFILYRNPFKLLMELLRVRRTHYRVVLNFIFNRMTSGALIANFICPRAITIGQGQEKYAFYFNGLLSLTRGTTHMFEMLIGYVERVFGLTVTEEERVLRLAFDPNAAETVNRFLALKNLRRRTALKNAGSDYIVFNVSARQENKQLSEPQSCAIANYLVGEGRLRTIVISAPEDRAHGNHVVNQAHNSGCMYFPDAGFADLGEIASLIEGALCVITPDTAIIHIASAVCTPVLGIFTPMQVNVEWLPYRVKYDLIRAPEGQPVSSISSEILISGIRKFLESVMMVEQTKEVA